MDGNIENTLEIQVQKDFNEINKEENKFPFIERMNISSDNDVNFSLNNSKDAINFTAMLALVLIANNKQDKVDMKLWKDNIEKNKFYVSFGCFSKNENLDDVAFNNRIKELIREYKSDISYFELLEKISPEVVDTLKIFDENVMEQEGMFKLAIKNNGERIDIKFGMDKNFSEIRNIFNEKGALTNKENDIDVVLIDGYNYSNQCLILNSTLNSLREKKNNLSKQNSNFEHQDVLILDDKAFGNHMFFITTMVANLILVGLFLFLFFGGL